MADITAEAISKIEDLVRASGDIVGVPETTAPVCVIPNSCKVVPLGEYLDSERLPTPRRIKGTANVLDASSFIQYFGLFCDSGSRVFADESQNLVTAVLDYHKDNSDGIGEASPRWGSHRIKLVLRESEEWQVWTAKEREKMTQMEFAEFLEDNAPDVVSPDAATMLEVARTLSAKIDVDFGSTIRLNNGSVKLNFSEQVKGTYGNGAVEIPESFVIAVPVYIGTERVTVTARLRYRVASGKVTFHYNLLRASAVERDAFMTARNSIETALSINIINGQPA